MKRELLFVFVFRVLVLSVSLTSTSNRCKQMMRVSVTPTSSAWCEMPLRAMFNQRDRYSTSIKRQVIEKDTCMRLGPWYRLVFFHGSETDTTKKREKPSQSKITKERERRAPQGNLGKWQVLSVISESFSARPSEKRCWKRWVWRSKTWRRCSRRRRCWCRNRYEQ